MQNEALKCAMRGVTRHAACMVMVLLAAACANTRQPLRNVSVAPNHISPNADGVADLARISYSVAVRTSVSIYLTDENGQRFDLRVNELRTPGPTFNYLFNGIAGGRMLSNGDYTWHVVAGEQVVTGLLKISDADVVAPKISAMTMSTRAFTPNRDAIDDRIYMSVFTTKKGKLSVYALGSDGIRYDVPVKQGTKVIDAQGFYDAGRWSYDFDGGIDLGADPPPDGDYVMFAELEDVIGQRDVVSQSFTIKDSGRPKAEILIQPNSSGIAWSGVAFTDPAKQIEVTLALSDTLFFSATVKNTGSVPIRTAGPFDPSMCYRMEENRYTKGFKEEPGVWRVGLDFETNEGLDHPWRWGVGELSDLTVVERDGDKLYYLDQGKQVVVRGCIQITKLPRRNPFYIWGALIQEQVEVVNPRVSPLLVKLAVP